MATITDGILIVYLYPAPDFQVTSTNVEGSQAELGTISTICRTTPMRAAAATHTVRGDEDSDALTVQMRLSVAGLQSTAAQGSS